MTWYPSIGKIPVWFCSFLIAILAQNVLAAPSESSCLLAIKHIAQESEVPYSVLEDAFGTDNKNIASWTVIADEVNFKFANPEAAKTWLFFSYLRGRRDFRVGCFQLSFQRFHHDFRTVDEMFDPYKNVRVFAGELISLRTKYGSWETALSIYRARQPNVAQLDKIGQDSFARFLNIFEKIKVPTVA